MLTAFAANGSDVQGTAGGGTFFFIYIVVMVLIFYFLLIRPQKKRQKKMMNMLDALQVGDEVVTAGGIVGKIVTIKENTVTLETSADRTKITFEKNAISRVNTIHE